MPGGLPLGLEICNGHNVGANTATSLGTTVTTSSTSNVKGAFTQLVAATSFDACWMVVTSPPGSVANSFACAIDIAVGSAGSEIVIAPNLVNPGSTFAAGQSVYSFPVSIPAGSRISARAQGDLIAGSPDTPSVSITLFDGSFTQMEGSAGVDAIGFIAGSTTGTVITAAATTNAKGAYAQLIASTARDYIGFLACVDYAQNEASDVDYLMDIAVGAAGQEVVIVPNVSVFTHVSFSHFGITGSIPLLPIPIPAGSRIAARCQGSVASGFFGLTLYGVNL